MNDSSEVRWYRLAIGFTFVFFVLHVISLPVSISYDGLIYIDMADVLGSSRFPQDWNTARTPLFPLALKFGFWLIGREPLAIIFVSSLLGLAGILAIGATIKRLLNPNAAAIVVTGLTLFPLLVSYQHYALTEVGSSFFLIAMTTLVTWLPSGRREIWIKALGLAAICALSYYWRQALTALAPVVALLHVIGSGRAQVKGHGKNTLHAKLTVLLQFLLIAALPFLLSKPWAKFVNEPGMRDVTLRQGILRQALLPPEHPFVGANASAYRQAVQNSIYKGAFYSGLRAEFVGSMSEKLYTRPMPSSVPAFYWGLIKQNPGRYLAGFGRTLVLFSGVKALENENLIAQAMILSPELPDSKIGEVPPQFQQMKVDFQQKTTAGAVQKLLWSLTGSYAVLLILGNVLTAIGFLIGILLRNKPLLMLCTIPVMYMANCAAVLASIDRYAFPAYPIVMANIVAVPLLIFGRFAKSPVER